MTGRRRVALAGAGATLVTTMVVGGAGEAQAATTYGAWTFNCGNITCSAYLSRSATKEVYESWIAGAGIGVAAEGACGYLPGVWKLACRSYVATAGGVLARTFKEAVEDHPPKGACFKVTFTKSSQPVVTWISTNNGTYCKD